MAIEVRFYGDLKQKVSSEEGETGFPVVLEIEPEKAKNALDIIQAFGIEKQEASHIFVNGDYSKFSREIEDGDRVTIFPKDMGLIYRWYFPKSKSKKS